MQGKGFEHQNTGKNYEVSPVDLKNLKKITKEAPVEHLQAKTVEYLVFSIVEDYRY